MDKTMNELENYKDAIKQLASDLEKFFDIKLKDPENPQYVCGFASGMMVNAIRTINELEKEVKELEQQIPKT